eukprot:5592089-Pleurochrysis_carterae.AAC.2
MCACGRMAKEESRASTRAQRVSWMSVSQSERYANGSERDGAKLSAKEVRRRLLERRMSAIVHAHACV